MKAFSVGLMAFAGIMTEGFITSGFWGCVVYVLLCVIGTIMFCWPHGKHERRRFK